MFRHRMICFAFVAVSFGRYYWNTVHSRSYSLVGNKNKDESFNQNKDAGKCVPLEYENINDTVLPIIVAIQMCDDQTKDPRRPSSDNIRSFWRQLRQAHVLIKSISLLTITPVHYAITANSKEIFKELTGIFHGWPTKYCKRISFSFHLMKYPKEILHLKYLNRPCASYRHVMYEEYPFVTRIIYFDTDVIVMKPLEDLIRHFSNFDENQIIGASAMLFAKDKRYRMFPKPQHGLLDDGINIGITLIRLDRWRFQMPNYLQSVKKLYDKYGKYFVFPTQDLFNVWLGTNKKHYYNLPCEWNVRRTLYTNFHPSRRTEICRSADNGTKALHGSGGHFTDGTYVYSHIFREFERHDMRKHSLEDLKYNLLKQFDELKPYKFRSRNDFKAFFLGGLLESIKRVNEFSYVIL